MAYTKYSLTPANNTATPPDGAPEGMLPSAVNDTMRDMMAQIRDVGDGIRDGTYTMTAAKITGGTITGVAFTGNTFTSPVISGGSINNTPIGASTANTGAFTTLSATGVTTVQAGTVSAPAITTSGDTNTGIFFPAADTIAFTEGATEAMRITSDGRLGVGTTSPQKKLSVSNGGAVGLDIDPTGRSGEAATSLLSYNRSTSAYVPAQYDASQHEFQTSNTERMRIDSSGNVGIGTSSPSYKVSAVVTSGSDVFFADANSQSFGGYRIRAGASGQQWAFRGGNTTMSLTDVTAGADRLVIDSSGNVGIGTSSPSSKLTVASSNVTVNAGYGIAFSGDQNRIMTPEDNVSGALIRWGSGGICRFLNGSTENMRIDSSGNVGIGSTSPTGFGAGYSTLRVNGSTGGVIELTSNNTRIIQITPASTEGKIETIANVPLLFGTNSTERMRITSGGELCVGATSPYNTEKLNVTSSNSSNSARTVNFYNSAATSTTRLNNQLVRLASNGSSADVCINLTDSVAKNYYYGGNNGGAYVVAGSNGVRLAENGTSWASDSDERLKDIIEPITNAADKVSTLRAVIGKYKTDEEGTRRSFLIAQDVQAVLPEAVFDEQGTLMLAYTDTIPLLVAAIKELNAKVEAQAAEIALLKSR